MDLGTAVLLGLLAGVVAGLIPLGAGFMKDRKGLGVVGFVVTALSGAVLGLLLAVPVAIVFTLAIVLMRREPVRASHA